MDLTKLKTKLQKLKQARKDADHSPSVAAVEIGFSNSSLYNVEEKGHVPKNDSIRKSLIKYIDKHLKKQSKGRK